MSGTRRPVPEDSYVVDQAIMGGITLTLQNVDKVVRE